MNKKEFREHLKTLTMEEYVKKTREYKIKNQCPYCRNQKLIWLCMDCYNLKHYDDIRLLKIKKGNKNWKDDLRKLRERRKI